MSSPAAPATIDLRHLRLDTARALLSQADFGRSFAAEDTPSVAYLQDVIDGLCELSLRDPLTGLANRRHFETVLERELDRVARSGEAALLLMLDIDHFKKINDAYGHPAGDSVLQAVAQAIAGCVRPMDTVARYGGEEFAVVLPACHAAFGTAVAERIRLAVAATPIRITPTEVIQVEISVGGAFALQWIRSTTTLWTERADLQLYRAKADGRNRVCLEPQPDSTVTAEEKNLLFLTVPPEGEDGGGIAAAQPPRSDLPPAPRNANDSAT
ncbi:GGDEF domain-containing protein [Xylophilus sp.]|uniref:GGDEF domain-containing protein n=1 Tax=Xylophilus sp. TaxID=2653893 RepID=UPI0013B5F5E5|nr:GGDEF domain-containing protein [Xylophilus sp.]KAF1047085.1 MAG: Response regulator PleD [Xylophilus sp.]